MNLRSRVFNRRVRIISHGVLALVAALLFTACASRGPTATVGLDDVVVRESASKQEIKALNDRLFASVGSAPQLQDYIIGEGDLLQVTVFEAEELNTTARVGARGAVTLPLLGIIDVRGLTTREAEQKIENAYKERYLEDPHVNIFVKEQHGGKITLLGALQKPGTYDYFGRQRLLDVMAMAGGLSDKAGQMVQVRREAEGSEHPDTLLIDMDELVKKGQADLNIEIQRGDVIFIPEAGMVYVDGAVRKPGMYPIKQTMTIQEAVVAAGGFSTTADEKNIKLLRHTGDGKREVMQLSVHEIRGGSAGTLDVKDRDVIFVETNRLEALLYGLRLNLGMGLVGIGYTPPPQ